jgi:hypothetical protein
MSVGGASNQHGKSVHKTGFCTQSRNQIPLIFELQGAMSVGGFLQDGCINTAHAEESVQE